MIGLGLGMSNVEGFHDENGVFVITSARLSEVSVIPLERAIDRRLTVTESRENPRSGTEDANTGEDTPQKRSGAEAERERVQRELDRMNRAAQDPRQRQPPDASRRMPK